MQLPLRPALSAGTTPAQFTAPAAQSPSAVLPQKPTPTPPQEDSVLFDLWQYLKRNHGWPLGATILGIAIAVVVTISQAPTFRATATLEIQDLNENFLNLKEVSPIAPDGTAAVQNDLQTQLRVLQSKSLIGRV